MAKDWRNRVTRTETNVDPATLTPNPRNWRTHPTLQQDALDAVIGSVGWVGRVFVNERTGHLVDGHLRVELARRTGRRVPIVDYVDLDEAEEAIILATYDPLSALAETDADALRALIEAGGITDTALRQMLDGLAPPLDGGAANDDLVGGDGTFASSLGFEITAVARDAASRDRYVAALEAVGATPTVTAHRE
jgi:hypothetical protein